MPRTPDLSSLDEANSRGHRRARRRQGRIPCDWKLGLSVETLYTKPMCLSVDCSNNHTAYMREDSTIILCCIKARTRESDRHDTGTGYDG
jgi:hypothetical protein